MKRNQWFGLTLLIGTLAILPAKAQDKTRAVVTGLTEPFLDVTLSSPVVGIIGARRFKEGDFVKEGQVIVELDRRLEELETTRRKVIAERARTDAEATRALFKSSKSVSQEELDKKEAEYKVAAADHEIAVEQLRKRQITSPLSGYIAEFFREVGEACQANERVVRVVDTRRCYFVCNLEAQAGYALTLDQPIRLEIGAGKSKILFPGKISFISPVVDPASGLLKVKVLWENPDGKIRPGVAATLHLTPPADGN